MSEARTFELGDILSITTGRLVSPRGVEALYDILNFMTGDNLFTHQLPRAMRECAPHLLRQYPKLACALAGDVTKENWREWLDKQIERFGPSLAVEPIPMDDHAHRDPLTELEQMVGKEKVIVVETDDGE